jgi:hypothetical protein
MYTTDDSIQNAANAVIPAINFSTLKKNAKNSKFVEKFSYNTNAN